jgi:hypothetical protein
MKSKFQLLLFAALAVSASAAENAANVITDKSPPSKVMAKYEKVLVAARKDTPAPGGIICIGSSHMELWYTVKADLAPLTVHNYGVGGSRMSQAAELFIDNLAIAFKPRAVVLYEGSNDIAGGRSCTPSCTRLCPRPVCMFSASCPARASASTRSTPSARRTNSCAKSARRKLG